MLMMKKTIGTVAYMGGVIEVPEEFCFALMQMLQYSQEYVCGPNDIIHVTRARTSYHSWARNILANQFQGDWLLMLDTDQTFEPDLLARLYATMAQQDLDVVTGLYHYKMPPFAPVIFNWNDKTNGFQQIGRYPKDATLIPVDCAGGGCLLVRRRVFDRIKTELKEEPFDILPPWSEDFSFFARLRKLGIKSWCMPKVEAYHLVMAPVTAGHCQIHESQLMPVEAEEHKPGDLTVVTSTVDMSPKRVMSSSNTDMEDLAYELTGTASFNVGAQLNPAPEIVEVR